MHRPAVNFYILLMAGISSRCRASIKWNWVVIMFVCEMLCQLSGSTLMQFAWFQLLYVQYISSCVDSFLCVFDTLVVMSWRTVAATKHCSENESVCLMPKEVKTTRLGTFYWSVMEMAVYVQAFRTDWVMTPRRSMILIEIAALASLSCVSRPLMLL